MLRCYSIIPDVFLLLSQINKKDTDCNVPDYINDNINDKLRLCKISSPVQFARCFQLLLARGEVTGLFLLAVITCWRSIVARWQLQSRFPALSPLIGRAKCSRRTVFSDWSKKRFPCWASLRSSAALKFKIWTAGVVWWPQSEDPAE